MEEINKLIQNSNNKSNIKTNFKEKTEHSISKQKYIKIISSILIFCFILFFYFIIHNFIIKSKKPPNIYTFKEILPKINLIEENYKANLSEIFNSRELFISDKNLTKDYINFIRPVNKTEEKKFKQKLYKGLMPNLSFTENRTDQIDLYKYYNICWEEKLISEEKIEYNNHPLISVLVPAYNKQDIILKSIRSIQNQSFKNIEIIIVNDASTDNSSSIFNYLLKTDPRIRIFTHLQNMGAWRSRLDAFLYSRAPYVIHFDSGDFYTDNYILEDAYHLITKYNLDSVRFSFKLSRNSIDLDNNSFTFKFTKRDRKIIYGRRSYNMLLYAYGPIWNRLTRANIFTKGLKYLDEYILNAYKNLYEDRWWNTIANNASYSYLMVNRVGYLYLRIPGGAGVIRSGTQIINEKTIKEFIYFWLFDYLMSYKKGNKTDVINNIKKYYVGNSTRFKLSDLKSYFPPYHHLLDLLINDKYITNEDKKFVLMLKDKEQKLKFF
jgi:glycosyltransferase involved in cell wall biosynthesis